MFKLIHQGISKVPQRIISRKHNNKLWLHLLPFKVFEKVLN